MGIDLKFLLLNVCPFQEDETGHFDKFTKVAPSGALPAILLPSAVISYNNAYSSNFGTPLGAKHDMDMRN
jgi:hypothetical protein